MQRKIPDSIPLGPVDKDAIRKIVETMTEHDVNEVMEQLAQLPIASAISGMHYVINKFPKAMESKAFVDWCVKNWQSMDMQYKFPPMFNPFDPSAA